MLISKLLGKPPAVGNEPGKSISKCFNVALEVVIVDTDPHFIAACRSEFSELPAGPRSVFCKYGPRCHVQLHLARMEIVQAPIQQKINDPIWTLDGDLIKLPEEQVGCENDLPCHWTRVAEVFDSQAGIDSQYFEDDWSGLHSDPYSHESIQPLGAVPFLSNSVTIPGSSSPVLYYRSVAGLRRTIARHSEEAICRDVLLRLAPYDAGCNTGKTDQSRFPQIEFWRDVNYGRGAAVDGRIRAQVLQHAEDRDGIKLMIDEHMDQSVLPVNALASDAETFVVYGGMGLGMPGGLINLALAEMFQVQFNDIQKQMQQEIEAQGGDLCPSDFTGHVYVSSNYSSEPKDSADLSEQISRQGQGLHSKVRLISCVAFPRAHNEERNVQNMFASALNRAVAEGTQSMSINSAGKIRVVTHSLGAFHGHMEPWKFARAMAGGLRDFLLSETASHSDAM